MVQVMPDYICATTQPTHHRRAQPKKQNGTLLDGALACGYRVVCDNRMVDACIQKLLLFPPRRMFTHFPPRPTYKITTPRARRRRVRPLYSISSLSRLTRHSLQVSSASPRLVACPLRRFLSCQKRSTEASKPAGGRKAAKLLGLSRIPDPIHREQTNWFSFRKLRSGVGGIEERGQQVERPG